MSNAYVTHDDEINSISNDALLNTSKIFGNVKSMISSYLQRDKGIKC